MFKLIFFKKKNRILIQNWLYISGVINFSQLSNQISYQVPKEIYKPEFNGSNKFSRNIELNKIVYIFFLDKLSIYLKSEE